MGREVRRVPADWAHPTNAAEIHDGIALDHVVRGDVRVSDKDVTERGAP